MTYGQIPSMETMIKMIQISFSAPDKNLAMYRLYSALKEHQGYIENEKAKLLDKYGTPVQGANGKYTLAGDNLVQYNQAMSEILNTELPNEIPYINLTEDDFSSANCSYPTDKAFCPSVADIGTILEFCEKTKKERGK